MGQHFNTLDEGKMIVVTKNNDDNQENPIVYLQTIKTDQELIAEARANGFAKQWDAIRIQRYGVMEGISYVYTPHTTTTTIIGERVS